MTEIKTQFVHFFSNLFKSVTSVTEPQDDSLESLHRLSCKGEIFALLKLGLMADRTAHAYAEYLFADALKTINRYPLLMSYYYCRAFKTGHVSNDAEQKKGAFLAAQALADGYDTGLYFPKNALFADHYRYEAACLNPEVGQIFLNEFREKESVSEINILQSSLVSLSLGNHEYAEKLLQTALERPLPTVITYFTALKNKIYIALGKQYEESSDYETAVHYYAKIKPQNAREFSYPFQAANIAFYTLNQPQQAIAILANTQPEMTLPKTTEKKDFFDYLFRWEKAWKAKEIIEFKKSGKTQSRNFEESSVNPMIDVYLKTQQGERMMANEVLNHPINLVEDISMQDFDANLDSYKEASPFCKKLKELLVYERQRLNGFGAELKENPLYHQRINEISILEEAINHAQISFFTEGFYDDTLLLEKCKDIYLTAKKNHLFSPYISSFRWHGGNRLIEKLKLIIDEVLAKKLVSYRNILRVMRAKEIETMKTIEIMGAANAIKDEKIREKNLIIANKEKEIREKNSLIQKFESGEIFKEKEIEIQKLTEALDNAQKDNANNIEIIKEQKQTICKQSDTIDRQLAKIDALNKKIDEQSTEIQGLNLSISKLHGDLARSEKKIQDLNQEIVEKTKAFEEKLENQVEAHTAELKKQAASHTIELDSIKKELEEKTKTFEEKLENQTTSHAAEINEMKRGFNKQVEAHVAEMDEMKKEFGKQFQDLNKKISEQNKALRNAGTRNTKNENKIDEYETFIKDCGGETYILEMKENYENYKKDSALFKKYTSAKNVDTPFGKNQTMETLEDYDSLICPITEDMFKDPVVAEDGYTYERSKIEQWFLKRKTSPMTGEPMGIALVENISLRNIISDFLNYNKSKLEEASENQKKFVLTTEFVSEKKEPANNPHAFFSQSNSMPTEISVTSNLISREEKESVFSVNSF